MVCQCHVVTRGFSRVFPGFSRPEITIEMRGFQWLGDSYAGGNELKTVNIGGCGRCGGFLKWWVSPTTSGFPTKNDHFGV